MKQRGRKKSAELALIQSDPPPRMTLPDPKAPKHLSQEAAAWWGEVIRAYDLEPHHMRLLQCACEAWDRQQQARQTLTDHGSITFTDQKGTIRAHPAVAIERDARIAFARLVRELDLDTGAPGASRPPALNSNRRG